MTAKKKPATARKAAKPVIAWAIISPRGAVWVASWWGKHDAKQVLNLNPDHRITRVRIVEVRR